MKHLLPIALLGLSVITSCQKKDSDPSILSEHYVHKYGYPVEKEEWETAEHPGQVIRHLRDGSTVTATYEKGILHGPYIHTHPHSQTPASSCTYQEGTLVKEILYDLKGIPTRERIQLSPSRYKVTHWYTDGAPRSIEEYANDEILEGQYFTPQNETEARVEKGSGKRVLRNIHGLLLSKEELEKGYPILEETFYANGMPHAITHYNQGKKHGERKVFNELGEPFAIEAWENNELNGLSTYFKNGQKALEIHYLHGLKEGTEIHYLDNDTPSQEIHWKNGKKHGPTHFYLKGKTHTEWFYKDQPVSKKKYEELSRLDEILPSHT